MAGSVMARSLSAHSPDHGPRPPGRLSADPAADATIPAAPHPYPGGPASGARVAGAELGYVLARCQRIQTLNKAGRRYFFGCAGRCGFVTTRPWSWP